MKIAALIKQLEKLKAKHGNIDALVFESLEQEGDTEEVRVILRETDDGKIDGVIFGDKEWALSCM